MYSYPLQKSISILDRALILILRLIAMLLLLGIWAGLAVAQRA